MAQVASAPEDKIAVDHREAARLLSISERHLHNLVTRGLIRRVKAGTKNLYPVDELHRFSKENLS